VGPLEKGIRAKRQSPHSDERFGRVNRRRKRPQLVLDEEERNAWELSLFPHLLLPDLVEARVLLAIF
jgi:hypothetical protein